MGGQVVREAVAERHVMVGEIDHIEIVPDTMGWKLRLYDADRDRWWFFGIGDAIQFHAETERTIGQWLADGPADFHASAPYDQGELAMSVEIAHDTRRQVAVMYCNTSDHAFGPIFTGPGCAEDADDFLNWLPRHTDLSLTLPFAMHSGKGEDPRDYTDTGLERMVQRWRDSADARRGVEA